MTPWPWYVAARRANVGTYAEPFGASSKYIKLSEFEWLRIKGKKGRIVAYVHAADDALIVIAGPRLYAALMAVHETIRYPRGVTEGEWCELRRQVADAVCTVAPLIEVAP